MSESEINSTAKDKASSEELTTIGVGENRSQLRSIITQIWHGNSYVTYYRDDQGKVHLDTQRGDSPVLLAENDLGLTYHSVEGNKLHFRSHWCWPPID